MMRLTILGIGEDGWAGLTDVAREQLRAASLILGAQRQLAMVPGSQVSAAQEAWPSPMMPRVQQLAEAVTAGDPAIAGTVVLASGDPMLHGLGATFARLVDPALLNVLPVPSAYSLACARLGWAQHDVPLVSLVADPSADPAGALRSAGRAVVYVPGTGGAAALAAQLRGAGLDAAQLTIFERLGGPHERRRDVAAATFNDPCDPLHLVACTLRRGEQATLAAAPTAHARRLRSCAPGLPDDAFGGDGQLTRADVRAVALAALAPAPSERLWDVGAGSGTIAIEWCRAAPGAEAIAVEVRADRCATIASNADALGAGGRVHVREGRVPDALEGLPAPDAIFVGGATSHPGLLAQCWDALAAGGRLVAAAVTFESERALIDAHARWGGRLVRLDHSHPAQLGRFTAWSPERPIVQWSATKAAAPSTPPELNLESDAR